MTVMKKILSVCLVSFFSLGAQSSLEFIQPSYFMHLVDAEDHEAFKEYYKNSMAHLKKLNNQQKAKELEEIRKFAYDMLSIKHSQWSTELKVPMQRAPVTAFLTRYGIFEQYLKDKAQKQGSVWYKIKSYTHNIGRQIAQWAGSFRKTKVTT